MLSALKMWRLQAAHRNDTKYPSTVCHNEQGIYIIETLSSLGNDLDDEVSYTPGEFDSVQSWISKAGVCNLRVCRSRAFEQEEAYGHKKR